MTQKALVVRRGGRLMAQVVRSEACAACRGCAFGQTETCFIALPDGGKGYREGDEVDLTLSEGALSRASLLAYGLPLVCFMAGLFLGGRLSESLGMPRDACAALGAILFTALSLVCIRLLEPRIRKSGRYLPVTAPCQEQGEKSHGD